MALEWIHRKFFNVEYEKSEAENCKETCAAQYGSLFESMENLSLYNHEIVPIVDCSRSVPHQTNGYDCGVFVIKYFQMLVCENPKTTTSCIERNFAEQFNPEYFTSDQVDEERSLIKMSSAIFN